MIIMCIYTCIGITPFVSLTVDGGGSLVGEQCPGTVKLFCKGVDLSILRWRYNGENEIYSFSTTDLPMISILSSPAFVSVELINVTQTPNDPRFGQFTSVLIVDIAQLQAQNIASINCGDPLTIDSKPVNVITLQPSVPTSPTITAVTATYKFGLLMTLEVSWMELVSTLSHNYMHAMTVFYRKKFAWNSRPRLYTC